MKHPSLGPYQSEHLKLDYLVIDYHADANSVVPVWGT